MMHPASSHGEHGEVHTQGLRVQGARSMRLPWRFDAAAALDEARQLPADLWRTHFNQGRHDGGWQALALTVAPNAPIDVMPMDAAPQSYVAADALGQCPAIQSILRTMALPFQSVRLMRLLPGSEIMEHTDAGVCAANGEARLHIPLQTDEQVFFHIAGERLPMRAGECWYTDVSLPHRVRNRSEQARIHLVMDALVDEQLAQAFVAGDGGQPMDASRDPWTEFQRFRAAVFDNTVWAESLMECTDLASLQLRSLDLGKTHGFAFETSDVESAMRAGRNAWTQQWVL
ncbi:aspartyl/asparaginyl beta-hydroxylase domain-containing protein [Diaphorobacter sp. HDW4B]|uniref:aspartyl/asparaginyl beta-hydroxylase domain-containing protein n=1 Tax=Diaphorobacter sp. HDW4B TaxID=2714925 RepID=UPI00140B4A6E|nr:aspartyl/asparaginyl beta-hydroxylase domain-containing protein [Diaphorobacter sp. HDW4B]QIL72979.1 aspartyl/asparaginyl beta-hydroxylase domain-containing protein [Diaphorobacter sp. HDW4B]